ncbi:MAG TPA: hypothetical protein VI408_14700 [Gaiellaceae bacterium]
MRRLLVLSVAVLTAALAAALHARASAATSPTSFRTPDAGAACRLEKAALVCSSLGTPASVALRSHGAPSVVRDLPWWDASTPVLHTFHRGGISCRLAGAALLCRGAGAAVRVDRTGVAVAS